MNARSFLARSLSLSGQRSVFAQRPLPLVSSFRKYSSSSGSDVPIKSPPPVSTDTEVFKQAPNRAEPWSRSQRERTDAMVGPRFEQTDLEVQPRPLAAIELIAEEPIRYVEGRSAVCDGGNRYMRETANFYALMSNLDSIVDGGSLGHPRDKPGAHACGYCGIRFEQKHH
ncbi:7577_t:CDS:2 [Paraglomus occultum]|uniref:7577_t:CDS:1 n=1 Tax=Paraglomus occultum TaxID=144539 RepID=A0A9N9A7T1_9GLOM|nr:7577_t:CDS:2 [Paraglomus occultum]